MVLNVYRYHIIYNCYISYALLNRKNPKRTKIQLPNLKFFTRRVDCADLTIWRLIITIYTYIVQTVRGATTSR